MVETINAWTNAHQAITLCIIVVASIIGVLAAYLVACYREYQIWNR